MSNVRETGYYWVKTKRTKIWIIAKWWDSLNKGKGWWDTSYTIVDDTRGGFSEIDERRIRREDEDSWLIKPKVKRTRSIQPKRTRNDKKTENTKLSKSPRKRLKF